MLFEALFEKICFIKTVPLAISLQVRTYQSFLGTINIIIRIGYANIQNCPTDAPLVYVFVCGKTRDILKISLRRTIRQVKFVQCTLRTVLILVLHMFMYIKSTFPQYLFSEISKAANNILNVTRNNHFSHKR